MDAVGKVFIFAIVANKAGVALDGLACEGGNVGNEGIWHAGTTQKDFGDVPKIDTPGYTWVKVKQIINGVRALGKQE